MDEVKSSPHKKSIYPCSVQFVRILVNQNCDESHYWVSGTSDTRLVLPYTHSSTRQMLHITWTNNWNKLTNHFPSHNMIQDLPSFDKRYSDAQFLSLTVSKCMTEITLIFRALVRILELRVLLLKVRQSRKQNHFQYIKLSQRSFFGRIEDTINCFRDLLTFTYF